MNNRKNFTTMGTFGDTVYSLCLVKMLGGGNMYVKLDALDDFAKNVIGWPNAGGASGRYTLEDYENIKPLLEAQDYLDSVDIWSGQQDDCTELLDHWKMHLIKGWQGNQTECYALTLDMDIHDPTVRKQLLHDPWLTPVTPIKVPGKSIIVNRTPRYLYGPASEEWQGWIAEGLSDSGLFVGTPQEHADFEKTFNIKIQYQKTENLLELAQYIQGSEMFIGNQSVALSIAIGLGKTYWCEIRKDFENTRTPHGGYGDTWFPRVNGFYF